MGGERLRVAAALGVTLFAWGMSYIWTKIVLEAMGPFSLVFVRFSLATLLFAAALMLLKRPLQPLSPGQHGWMFVLALLQPAGHFAFETCGLLYTSASAAALIVAAIPLAVLVLEMLAGRRQRESGELVRILVSMVGVAAIILGGSGTAGGGGALTGNLLMLGAVFSTAGYVVLGGNLIRRIDPLTVTFMQVAWGAVLFLPGCLWETARHGLPRLDVGSLGALGALTVLASFGAFLCYNYVLGRRCATWAALWLNAVPVVTSAAAWALLDERLGFWQMAGGLVVCLAVVLPGWHGRKRCPEAV